MHLDVLVPSPVLVVIFGGLLARIGGIPPFEFFGLLNEVTPTKKVFFRDLNQSWYHQGISDGAPDIPGMQREVEDIVVDLSPAKVVMLGSSAGGYAAILFGRLTGVATEVHAFGPQTFIDPALRLRYADKRWHKQWSELMRSGSYQQQYGDLHRLFEHTPLSRTRFVIHYDPEDRLDALHARHLGGYPDVQLQEYAGLGHNVAGFLRDGDELRSLLQQALTC